MQIYSKLNFETVYIVNKSGIVEDIMFPVDRLSEKRTVGGEKKFSGKCEILRISISEGHLVQYSNTFFLFTNGGANRKTAMKSSCDFVLRDAF